MSRRPTVPTLQEITEALELCQKPPEGGLTYENFQEAWGLGEVAVRKRVRAAVRAGLLKPMVVLLPCELRPGYRVTKTVFVPTKVKP
jgi:DNA-binding Lrp family transcriptional regulator